MKDDNVSMYVLTERKFVEAVHKLDDLEYFLTLMESKQEKFVTKLRDRLTVLMNHFMEE